MEDESRLLKIGIAGCGRVTMQHHLPAIAGLPDITVIAVADPDRDQRRAAMDRFGIGRGYSSAHEMLDGAPELDLVAVAAPPSAHAEIGLAALRRGLAVVIEKPLALDLAEADRLVELASTTGRPAFSGFNLRCHRLVEEAKALVESGRLGNIRAVRSALTASSRMWSDLPDWRRGTAEGGGALFELGVHHVDLWRHLLGLEIVGVTAVCGHSPVPEETVTLGARLEGDVVCSGLFCQGTAASHSLEILGDDAELRLSLYRADGLEVQPVDHPAGGPTRRLTDLRRSLGALWTHRRTIRRGGLYLDSFRRHWAAIASAFHTDTPPPSTLEDGRRALQVLLAARRSERDGRLERLR